jgi:arylsulfatase A-like enzyme
MIKKLLDSSWFYYAAAALLVLGYAATQVEIELPAREFRDLEDIRQVAEIEDLNVVFILIDTLRADHLSSYGYERETSPIMDRLAETGIRFQNHVAQSTWTKTSMASLWTGTYPVTNEILRFSHALPDEVTMPAELFREAGYRTAGLYRNGWVGHEFGFQQGFEKYIRPSTAMSAAALERVKSTPHQLVGSDWDLTSSAVEFVTRYREDKFFLYLHYMDIHQFAYEEASALFGAGYEDAYDNSIHWTDRNVGTLVAHLEELDLMDNTLVVIAADHGEAFMEHGQEGHAKDVHVENIYTPAIIVLPWFLDEPRVIEDVTENVDLWPTILDIVGIEPVDDTDGRSLVPLILGEADPHPGPAYAHLDRSWANTQADNPTIAVRTDDKKLIWWPKHGRNNSVYYYDVVDDPAEQINLHEEDPEAAAEMIGLASEYLEREPASWDASPDSVEIDSMKLSILQALGYVIGE